MCPASGPQEWLFRPLSFPIPPGYFHSSGKKDKGEPDRPAHLPPTQKCFLERPYIHPSLRSRSKSVNWRQWVGILFRSISGSQEHPVQWSPDSLHHLINLRSFLGSSPKGPRWEVLSRERHPLSCSHSHSHPLA